jgi:hypothetical protein
MRTVVAIIYAAAILGSAPSRAQPSDSAANRLVGTWKLKAHVQETVETGEKWLPRGENPNGYFIFAPDGRMSAIIVPGNRTAPADIVPTDLEVVALMKNVSAYGGRYRVESDRIVIAVDISWEQTATGTEQVRYFKLEGDTLTIAIPAVKSRRNGKVSTSTLVWEKVH